MAHRLLVVSDQSALLSGTVRQNFGIGLSPQFPCVGSGNIDCRIQSLEARDDVLIQISISLKSKLHVAWSNRSPRARAMRVASSGSASLCSASIAS